MTRSTGGAYGRVQWRRGATRLPNKPRQQIAVITADDEEEAFFSLKAIKRRARREAEELRAEKAASEAKRKITLPKIGFLSRTVPE
jgi:hypothetical protein